MPLPHVCEHVPLCCHVPHRLQPPFTENDGKTIIQCKNHKNPVGPSTVRELYGVMRSEKSKKGDHVDKSGSSKSAPNIKKSGPKQQQKSDDL